MNVTPNWGSNFASGTSGGDGGFDPGGFNRSSLGFRQPRRWLPHLQQAGGLWWCTYGNESCVGDTKPDAFNARVRGFR